MESHKKQREEGAAVIDNIVTLRLCTNASEQSLTPAADDLQNSFIEAFGEFSFFNSWIQTKPDANFLGKH